MTNPTERPEERDSLRCALCGLPSHRQDSGSRAPSPVACVNELRGVTEREREVLELTRSRLHGRTDFYGLWKRINDVLRGVKV